MFCRRDAAARTGYVTPGQAASHEQTNGTVLGTLGGAALGAAIGGAAGNAGAGAAIGAGAGLIGGTAVGADNARRAASDVEQNYAAAYYACMGEANGGPGDANYAYGTPAGRCLWSPASGCLWSVPAALLLWLRALILIPITPITGPAITGQASRSGSALAVITAGTGARTTGARTI